MVQDFFHFFLAAACKRSKCIVHEFNLICILNASMQLCIVMSKHLLLTCLDSSDVFSLCMVPEQKRQTIDKYRKFILKQTWNSIDFMYISRKSGMGKLYCTHDRKNTKFLSPNVSENDFTKCVQNILISVWIVISVESLTSVSVFFLRRVMKFERKNMPNRCIVDSRMLK